MSYTPYPQEANSFESKAVEIKGKVNALIGAVNNAGSILSSCTPDMFTTVAVDTISVIKGKMEPSLGVIDGDVALVHSIANRLEDEERQRQLALEEEDI